MIERFGYYVSILFLFGIVATNGCDGALNAQSKAVHTAIVAGGWNNDNSPLE